MQKKISIDGMTCSACSAAVERGVSKLDGVEGIAVNLTTNLAVVDYDENAIKLSDIQAKIIKLGYTPTAVIGDEVDANLYDEGEEKLKSERYKLVTASVFGALLLLVSMGHMMGLNLPDFISPDVNPMNFAVVQLLLTLPIVFVGHKFYTIGYKTLFRGNPNMDSLIAVSTTAALLYSLYSMAQIAMGHVMYAHQLYFETAGVIIALIMVGKYLESRSKYRTSDAIRKLINLKPSEANVRIADAVVTMPASEVGVGDIVVVRSGEVIPNDGVVTVGSASVDESMISGESIPVDKFVGDNVIGGSINTNGAIDVEVTQTGANTVLSRIIQMVEDAQGKKAPIARIADTISGYFVPVVMLIALVSGLIWFFVTHDTVFSLKIFIAVLVIACPCALGLATPTAIMVATGKAAEHGILIKSGEALEQAHSIDAIVLDKTGTITEGKPTVADIKYLSDFEEKDVLSHVVSVEALSEHPLAKAMVSYGGARGVQPSAVTAFSNIVGRGISAMSGDVEVVIGNTQHLASHGIAIDSAVLSAYADRGQTPVVVGLNGKAAAIIALEDEVKQSSIEAVKGFNKLGIDVYMLTGDNEKTARAIASQVGIKHIKAGVKPEDKANFVADLKLRNHHVGMVGDGVNDAPALAGADVGFAIGSGTDIAAESADVVLLKNDLNSVHYATSLSRATIKNIKQNLFWAFFYNVLGIPIAAGVVYAFGGPLLSPMIGAFAMSLSSVSVVTNALRLRNFQPKR